jgi:hypothetical protein
VCQGRISTSDIVAKVLSLIGNSKLYEGEEFAKSEKEKLKRNIQ